MAYFDKSCQFCGVPFCIARIRRSDEPYEAGWDRFGIDHIEASEEYECDSSTGCEDTENGEHLAGPRCKSGNGYSAYRISAVEMMVCIMEWAEVRSRCADMAQGINQVQCLVWKRPEWVPEDDDEDFELDSRCFLTAPSITAPDERDTGPLQKVRHGVSHHGINNYLNTDRVRLCFETLVKFPWWDM